MDIPQTPSLSVAFSLLAVPRAVELRKFIALHFWRFYLALAGLALLLSVHAGTYERPFEHLLSFELAPVGQASALILVLFIYLFPKERLLFGLVLFAMGFIFAKTIQLYDHQSIPNRFWFFAFLDMTVSLLIGLGLGKASLVLVESQSKIFERLNYDTRFIIVLFGIIGVGGFGGVVITYAIGQLLDHGANDSSTLPILFSSLTQSVRGASLVTTVSAIVVTLPLKRQSFFVVPGSMAAFALLAVLKFEMQIPIPDTAFLIGALLFRAIFILNTALIATLAGSISYLVTSSALTDEFVGISVTTTLSLVTIAIVDMILVERNWKLRVRRKNLKKLFESQELSRIGFFFYSPELNIAEFDPSAQKMLGVSDATGFAALFDRLEKDQRREIENTILEARVGTSIEKSLFLGSSDPQRKGQLFRLFIELDHTYSGKLALFGTIVDVTELHEIQLALKESNEALQNAETKRNLMLAVISHEMRHPASLLKQNIELGLQSLDGPDKIFSRLNGLADQLLKIMDDMTLILGKDESRSLASDEFDLAVEVEHLIEAFLPDAHKRNLALSIQAKQSCALWIRTDKRLLLQIFSNILRNSIIHSGASNITVRVDAEHLSEDRLKVHAVIEDDGCGIPLALREKLFDPFNREGCGVFSKEPGSGLGFYIAQTLAGALGSRIEFETEIGVGTAFSLTFEFERAHQHVLPAVEPAPVFKTALLVEDSDLLAEVTMALFRSNGLSAIWAPTLEQSAELLQEYEPDLVFLDGNLPDGDGAEFASSVRGRLPNANIIGLTASLDPGVHARFVAAGANDVFIKPLTGALLKRILNES